MMIDMIIIKEVLLGGSRGLSGCGGRLGDDTGGVGGLSTGVSLVESVFGRG
jgi:hypothetical protein